jgi:hypothetical protein
MTTSTPAPLPTPEQLERERAWLRAEIAAGRLTVAEVDRLVIEAANGLVARAEAAATGEAA